MGGLWVLFAAPIVSFALTALVRGYAVASSLLDVPNHRTSHAGAIPRGGGLAIVIVVLAALPPLAVVNGLSLPLVLSVCLGGGVVAAIGWWDDHAALPAQWRLLAHLLCAAFVLYMAGGAPVLPLPGGNWDWGILGFLVWVLVIGWMLNLYNFMDGIDGIAGIEALTVAGVGSFLLWWLGDYGWAMISAVLAMATAGFLAWNWPPARIFMGDVGSGFLGFMLATFALLTSVETPLTLWPWLILLGVFIVDATLTLLRRLFRGERPHEAHCSHAYQHAAKQIGSHLPVTVAVMVINLVWLAPLAVAAMLWPAWGIVLVGIAWFPLLLLAIKFRAGLAD